MKKPKKNINLKIEELKMERIDQMKEVLHKLPRDITLEELRIAFIEHILKLNNHNRTATALELGVNYTSIMAMIRRGYIKAKRPRAGRPKDSE
jgi:transcriptional regulator with PAS, ATPase and Fis domain